MGRILLVGLMLTVLVLHAIANSLAPLMPTLNPFVKDDVKDNRFRRKINDLNTNVWTSVSKLWARKRTIFVFDKPPALPKVTADTKSAKTNGRQKKKLLILMSDTGGGHRASAQAIDQAIQQQFPGKIDVEIMDIWTNHAAWPYKNFVPVYRFLAKRPMLWRGFFAYGTFPPTRKLTEIQSWRNSYVHFKAAIETSNPDFVVSVHPLCHLMPISIVQEMNRRDRVPQNKPTIPFVTVVTDLGGGHNTWFDPRADAIYVPSEAVRKIALRNRIPAQKILMKGLPIRPAFWKDTKPKTEIRRKLDIPVDSKTVLLMGGGDGVGGIEKIATTLATTLQSLTKIPTQLVVVCGHNKQLAQSLSQKLVSATPSASANNNNNKHANTVKLSPITAVPLAKHQVMIKGFVQNIDEFMGAADVLVTKAGPGTIAEAMVRGLPLILSSFLPGQEAGNVPYVVNGGFGVYTGNNPKKIAQTVTQWFQDPQRLDAMSKRAKEQSKPEATMAIAKDIAECILQR